MLGRIVSRTSLRGRVLTGRGRHVTGGTDTAPLTPRTTGRGIRGRRASRAGHPGHRPGLRSVSLVVAATVAAGIGAVAADHSAADVPRTRAAFAPRATTGWHNDATLGRTERVDQYAQAQVSGLHDERYSAGFRLRYTDRTHQVLVAVSGSGWLIQPSGQPAMTGSFVHAPAGLFRAEIEGRTVRARWNGVVVATRQIPGGYSGRHVVTTVRQPPSKQPASAVTMRSIRASSLPRTAPVPAGPSPISGGGTWWSGAAGPEAAAGMFGAWRGSAVTIGGTWTDTYDAQTDQWMICGGPWRSWNGPLDLAVGAIYRDRRETWAAAAAGAYRARWTTALTRIRSCWGNRPQGNLHLRFAHEMNLASSPWAVRAGDEKNFVAAMKLFSDLRYQLLPQAKIVFCPNDGTDGALKIDIRALWPGKDAAGRPVADVYGVDSYNAWPHVTTAAAFTKKINASYSNGAPQGLEKHRLLAASLGVPFAVPEWSNNGAKGTSGGGGESEVFVQQFNAWARAHAGDPTSPRAGQFLYEVHFNMWTQYAFWPRTVQPRTAAAYRGLRWGR